MLTQGEITQYYVTASERTVTHSWMRSHRGSRNQLRSRNYTMMLGRVHPPLTVASSAITSPFNRLRAQRLSRGSAGCATSLFGQNGLPKPRLFVESPPSHTPGLVRRTDVTLRVFRYSNGSSRFKRVPHYRPLAGPQGLNMFEF